MNALMFEIERVHYLSLRHLFDDAMLKSWTQANKPDLYNIYFITVAKKYRFDLARTSTNMLGELKTYIKVGGVPLQRLVTHVHKCNASLFQALHKAFPFGDVGTEFRIDRSASDETTLIINVKLASDHKPIPLPLLVENVLEAADCRLGMGGSPRIVYIGQSFRILERLRSHERINETSAKLLDDEELHISLVQFRTGYMGKYLDKGWGFFLLQHDPQSAPFKDKISVLERILIAFFRPALNEQHVNTRLEDDQLVSQIVKRYSIGAITLGVGVHGVLGSFWSPGQVAKCEVVSYSFVEPSLGFRPGTAMAEQHSSPDNNVKGHKAQHRAVSKRKRS